MLSLFGFSQIKTIAIALAGLAIVTILGLGYWHYTSLLRDIEVLRANEAVLKTAVETQTEAFEQATDALDDWRRAQEQLVQRVERMQAVAEAARDETRRLNDLFANHDLGSLAQARPGLVERRLNDGTAAALRMLECASGAEGDDCAGGPAAAGEDPGAAQPPAD